MSFPIHLLSQQYSYMFYPGLLVPPCTNTEGPCSPRPVTLFTLNHRVFRPFIWDLCLSSRTFIPCPRPLSLVPGLRPSSQAFVPRPGPLSLVLQPIFTHLLKSPFWTFWTYNLLFACHPKSYRFITPSPPSEKKALLILV